MAVYRYGFDIHRPNPAIALGAAQLGETMRSNRMAEAQAAARQRAQAEETAEKMRQYGVQDALKALEYNARAYDIAGSIEDPSEAQRVYGLLYDRGRRLFQPRNGVDPYDGFSRTIDPTEAQASRAFMPAQKTGSTAQKIADLRQFGMSDEEIAEILKPAPAAQVTITEADKPLGADAQKYRNAENQMPPSTYTPRQAEAEGFALQTPERLDAMKEAAKNREMIQFLDEEVEQARAKYEAALSALETAPSNEARRDAQNAASDLQTALAGRGNWRGEPSGEVATRYTVPGPIQALIEKGIALLGGAETTPAPQGNLSAPIQLDPETEAAVNKYAPQ